MWSSRTSITQHCLFILQKKGKKSDVCNREQAFLFYLNVKLNEVLQFFLWVRSSTASLPWSPAVCGGYSFLVWFSLPDLLVWFENFYFRACMKNWHPEFRQHMHPQKATRRQKLNKCVAGYMLEKEQEEAETLLLLWWRSTRFTGGVCVVSLRLTFRKAVKVNLHLPSHRKMCLRSGFRQNTFKKKSIKIQSWVIKQSTVRVIV